MQPIEGESLQSWGTQLRAWRESNSLSRVEFCRALKAEVNTDSDSTFSSRYVNPEEKLIYLWESGRVKQGPQGVYRRALARMGAPVPVVASGNSVALPSEVPVPVVPSTHDAEDNEDVDRRNFLRGAVVAALGGTLQSGDSCERLNAALSGQSPSADNRLIDAVADATRSLYDAEERMASANVAGAVSRHLGAVTDLLEISDKADVRQKLTSQAGMTAALAGWLAFDRRDLKSAREYYDVAERAANDSCDYALAACVRTYRSYLASTDGDSTEALRYLTSALEVLPEGMDASMTAWVSARQGEECANLGDSSGALRAFDRAYTAIQFRGNTTQLAWTRFFVPNRLDGMAVSVFARIHRVEAEMDRIAERLLANLGSCSTKVDSVALADVACAYLERGDLDRGVEIAQRTLGPIEKSESRVAYDRLSSISNALSRFGNAKEAHGLRMRVQSIVRV